MSIQETIAPLGHTIIALSDPPTETTAWIDHLNSVSDAINQKPAILVIPFADVEAAALLMNRQMEKSTLYREYRDKAQKAMSTGDNALYLENVQAATQIAAQSEIGKIFHNKQALMAFMGITMNMEKGGFKEYVENGVNDSVGAVQMSHERQAAQEYGKDGSFDTARFNARVENYNGISGWLGDLKQGLADFAATNTDVAAAASAAVVGLTAVGAAGGIASLAMGRMGAGGLLGGAGAVATGGTLATAGQFALAGVGIVYTGSYGRVEFVNNTDEYKSIKFNASVFIGPNAENTNPTLHVVDGVWTAFCLAPH